MDIRLMQIHMENFKHHEFLTLDFGGENCSIYGDNATGKTSVYDALTWLLFGKDSTGNGEKNMEIKPLNGDGSVKDHQAVTEVAAIFRANGEDLHLKRTYQEVWSTKRGSLEATYDGNTSEYYIEGVPVKANAFKAKVAELVDEDLFRMLTNVSWFPSGLSWQKRREILFDLFGAQDDREIMQADERFAPLLEGMGRHTLEDYRKMMAAEKKNLTGVRNEIPARISECEKTISDLSAMDFDGADQQTMILRGRLDSLNKELLAIEQNTAVQNLQLELDRANLQLDTLERDNRMYREAQKRQAPNTATLEREIRQKGATLASVQRSLEMRQRDIAYCDQVIGESRAKWKEINAEVFRGTDTCPTCGQKLPESRLKSAAEGFAADKKRRCDELVKKSERYKEDKAQYEREAEENRKYIAELKEEIRKGQEALDQERAAAAGAVLTDKPGYAEERKSIEDGVARLRQELKQLTENSRGAADGIRSRIAEVRGELDRVSGIAGKRSAYEYAKGRIEELRAQARFAAEQLAKTEQMLWLMEEYSRFKAGFVEDGINKHFELAKFRLFREQANGGTEDRCDVTYDGVPYTGLNNGMKINVGIDIINTLGRLYGVRVPLFIDNAEAVTRIMHTDGQMIRLVVSEQDKELRLHHEN